MQNTITDVAEGLAEDVTKANGATLTMDQFYAAAAVQDPDADEDEIDNAWVAYQARH